MAKIPIHCNFYIVHHTISTLASVSVDAVFNRMIADYKFAYLSARFIDEIW